jgi:hypothetical protein
MVYLCFWAVREAVAKGLEKCGDVEEPFFLVISAMENSGAQVNFDIHYEL